MLALAAADSGFSPEDLSKLAGSATCLTKHDCLNGADCVNGVCEIAGDPPSIPELEEDSTASTSTESKAPKAELKPVSDNSTSTADSDRPTSKESDDPFSFDDETTSTLKALGSGPLVIGVSGAKGENETSSPTTFHKLSTLQPQRAYAFCSAKGYTCMETSCEVQKAEGAERRKTSSGKASGGAEVDGGHYCRYFWGLFEKCGHCVAVSDDE